MAVGFHVQAFTKKINHSKVLWWNENQKLRGRSMTIRFCEKLFIRINCIVGFSIWNMTSFVLRPHTKRIRNEKSFSGTYGSLGFSSSFSFNRHGIKFLVFPIIKNKVQGMSSLFKSFRDCCCLKNLQRLIKDLNRHYRWHEM